MKLNIPFIDKLNDSMQNLSEFLNSPVVLIIFAPFKAIFNFIINLEFTISKCLSVLSCMCRPVLVVTDTLTFIVPNQPSHIILRIYVLS